MLIEMINANQIAIRELAKQVKLLNGKVHILENDIETLTNMFNLEK